MSDNPDIKVWVNGQEAIFKIEPDTGVVTVHAVDFEGKEIPPDLEADRKYHTIIQYEANYKPAE